jgi:hypothetical protein
MERALVAKTAYMTPRSVDITPEERELAKKALGMFEAFTASLWRAQQRTERLMNVFGKVPDIQPEQLFKVRQHLRKFQREIRTTYSQLIPEFSAALQSLEPFAKDTETANIREALLDAMQQLSEIVEAFMEAIEDFNAPDQVQRMNVLNQKAQQLTQSLDTVIDDRLRDHFEKNILRRKRIGDLKIRIMRRARLVRMLEV